MAVSRNAIRKAGHRACLREMTGPNFPHLCFYQQFFTRVISRYIFRWLEARVFEVKMKKKKLQRYKVSSADKSLYVICGNYLHILAIIIAQNVPRVVVFKVIIFIIK